MGDKLTPEELAEFREIFNLVDKDGGGTISKEELGELMETLGIDATPEEIDLMIAEIDEDNNGVIDFDEFVAVMSRKGQRDVHGGTGPRRVPRLRERRAAGPHQGRVMLVRALTTDGSDKLSEEQARDLVAQLEPDRDGLSTTRSERRAVMMSDRKGPVCFFLAASPRTNPHPACSAHAHCLSARRRARARNHSHAVDATLTSL